MGGVALALMPAGAQPGGGFTYTSLEARTIQARVIFRGTITHVSDAVIHTNNQFSRAGVFANKPVENYDIHNYTFTLTVDEVLKGNLPRQPLEFTINQVGEWPALEKWADERASFLWFVNDSEKTIGADFFAGLNPPNNIYLGPKLPERMNDRGVNDYPRVYDMDMTILTKREDILARARAFARKRIATARFHSIRLPELSSSDHYFFNDYLLVPVEPALEETARHLIARPDDFIITNRESNLVLQWRCDFRADGVSALQYFKSAANIKLLKSLLNAPDYWSEFPNYKIYSVRQASYEVLHGWGVDVPKPVLAETVPANGAIK